LNDDLPSGYWQVRVPRSQLSPRLQVLAMQHGWPAPPHWPHTALRLHWSGASHWLPGQQSCPAPPQLLGHMPAMKATQVFEPMSQQLAPVHAVPVSQQAWPAPPHARQVPPAQPSPPPLQVRPGQQICPAPPHCWHALLPQASPPPHTSLSQHG
jgi:hypothetical protein